MIEAVADRVARKLGHGTAVVYTTHKSGPHIPGKTRSWMLRHVQAMPGARKVGRDWTIAASDFDAYAAAKDTSRMRKPATLHKTVDDHDYAVAALAAAGTV